MNQKNQKSEIRNVHVVSGLGLRMIVAFRENNCELRRAMFVYFFLQEAVCSSGSNDNNNNNNINNSNSNNNDSSP